MVIVGVDEDERSMRICDWKALELFRIQREVRIYKAGSAIADLSSQNQPRDPGVSVKTGRCRSRRKVFEPNGGGGEDRTPDLGVMNPETMHFRTVDTVEVFNYINNLRRVIAVHFYSLVVISYVTNLSQALTRKS